MQYRDLESGSNHELEGVKAELAEIFLELLQEADNDETPGKQSLQDKYPFFREFLESFPGHEIGSTQDSDGAIIRKALESNDLFTNLAQALHEGLRLITLFPYSKDEKGVEELDIFFNVKTKQSKMLDQEYGIYFLKNLGIETDSSLYYFVTRAIEMYTERRKKRS